LRQKGVSKKLKASAKMLSQPTTMVSEYLFEAQQHVKNQNSCLEAQIEKISHHVTTHQK
jgi:hypothetical protein